MGAVSNIRLVQARANDLEALVQLRIDAMRASLERIGRFDPARARERFASGFDPDRTRHIVLAGEVLAGEVLADERVGFIVVQQLPDALMLEHLYVRPAFQGRGIGARVLGDVFQRRMRGASMFAWVLYAKATRIGFIRDTGSSKSQRASGTSTTSDTRGSSRLRAEL